MSKPLRVLVVDDEILIADHLALILEDAGHDVVGLAACAEEALAMLMAERPDVAILDIRLKGERDGIQLASDMKEAGFNVPHIFITGSGDPETKAKAEETAPVAFIQKPFDSGRLISIVAACASDADRARVPD